MYNTESELKYKLWTSVDDVSMSLNLGCFLHLLENNKEKNWFQNYLKQNIIGEVGQEEKVVTEDEMGGWHPQVNRYEFEQALGVGDGQGSLACCSPWGRKESDTTEWLNKSPLKSYDKF